MQHELPAVCTIVLNYNTWQLTQACVESLLSCRYPKHTIIIVDNASTNDSVDKLKTYFGSVSAISVQFLLWNELPITVYNTGETSIVFIQSATNGGYATGNNLGLRWALAQPDMVYFWVLNNDTVVAPDALSALVGYACANTNQPIGLIGSLIFEYKQPSVVQTVGEQYNPWRGVAQHIGTGKTDLRQLPKLLPKVSFIMGAACFGSRYFLEEIGLMQEDYFLYYEDNDWSQRGQRNGLPDQVCLTSWVFHHGGGSTQGAYRRVNSPLVEYCFARNKIRFTKRYYPCCLPTVVIGAFAAALLRVFPQKPKLAAQLIKITFAELLGRDSFVDRYIQHELNLP